MKHGIEVVCNCHDPSLDNQFHIGCTQPVIWETWFPLA